MAKKVRFPLEMDNGVEVRSIEELKYYFSLSRVLGYVVDGKMVTWLKDRYATDLADAVEKLDKEDSELAKKVCEIFDVPYNETAGEELEKAEERNRKLALLKDYPDAMDYSNEIDNVAFDQDDLYDLLDEEAETIYLCGSKFSIPTAKKNIRYVGITDNVVISITTKNVIDFVAKEIVFENCKFDEKYQALLDAVEKEQVPKIEEALVEEELDEEIDESEVDDFVEDLLETIAEFEEDDYENDYDDLYSYDGSIECDSDYYDDSGFDSKAKAKVACKNAITVIISETMKFYDDCKKELVEDTEVYYRSMIQDIPVFIYGTFNESFDALLEVHCSDETREYLLRRKKEFYDLVSTKDQKLGDIIHKSCNDAFDSIVDSTFGATAGWGKNYKKILDVKELLNMCVIDDDGDGDYYFETSDACDDVVSTLEGIIEDAEESFPEAIYNAYSNIRKEYTGKLLQWVESLRVGQGKNKFVATKSGKAENIFEWFWNGI